MWARSGRPAWPRAPRIRSGPASRRRGARRRARSDAPGEGLVAVGGLDQVVVLAGQLTADDGTDHHRIVGEQDTGWCAHRVISFGLVMISDQLIGGEDEGEVVARAVGGVDERAALAGRAGRAGRRPATSTTPRTSSTSTPTTWPPAARAPRDGRRRRAAARQGRSGRRGRARPTMSCSGSGSDRHLVAGRIAEHAARPAPATRQPAAVKRTIVVMRRPPPSLASRAPRMESTP